jgi:hypothetical protein
MGQKKLSSTWTGLKLQLLLSAVKHGRSRENQEQLAWGFWFLKTYTRNKNNKFKLFWKSQKSC